MGYDADTGKFDDAYEYVPVVVTNGAGDAPVLLDLGGKGYRTSMITTNCARPDRVIKMFDYLMSEQGQAECYYGEEGKTFRYVVKPGETVEVTKPDGSTASQVSTYGKIEWTDSAKEMLGSTANTWYGAGLKQISLLQNPMYVMMTSLYSAEMDTYQFYWPLCDEGASDPLYVSPLYLQIPARLFGYKQVSGHRRYFRANRGGVDTLSALYRHGGQRGAGGTAVEGRFEGNGDLRSGGEDGVS